MKLHNMTGTFAVTSYLHPRAPRQHAFAASRALSSFSLFLWATIVVSDAQTGRSHEAGRREQRVELGLFERRRLAGLVEGRLDCGRLGRDVRRLRLRR